MTIRLNGSTSGYTEIDAPAVAGSNTILLPAGNGSANQFLKNGSTAGTLGWSSATENSSGDFAFNSGYGSAAVAYGCRAWVNFNGTTASPSTIRGSGNVSSVTKNGTGDYTVNFTTAMVDANYVIEVNGYQNLTNSTCFAQAHGGTYTSSAVRITTMNFGGTATDMQNVSVAIFR